MLKSSVKCGLSEIFALSNGEENLLKTNFTGTNVICCRLILEKNMVFVQKTVRSRDQ